MGKKLQPGWSDMGPNAERGNCDTGCGGRGRYLWDAGLLGVCCEDDKCTEALGVFEVESVELTAEAIAQQLSDRRAEDAPCPNSHAGGGEAVIEDGCIVIRIPICALPGIVKYMECEFQSGPPFEITDPTLFAKDLVQKMNHGDVTSALHEFIDDQIHAAWQLGAQGVTELPDTDSGDE